MCLIKERLALDTTALLHRETADQSDGEEEDDSSLATCDTTAETDC